MPNTITNKNIFDELKDLRLEMKGDMGLIKKDVKINTAFRNNLSGKIAIGVLTIGTFISAVTGIVVTFINNKINK